MCAERGAKASNGVLKGTTTRKDNQHSIRPTLLTDNNSAVHSLAGSPRNDDAAGFCLRCVFCPPLARALVIRYAASLAFVSLVACKPTMESRPPTHTRIGPFPFPTCSKKACPWLQIPCPGQPWRPPPSAASRPRTLPSSKSACKGARRSAESRAVC